jgi:hypothetical protein
MADLSVFSLVQLSEGLRTLLVLFEFCVSEPAVQNFKVVDPDDSSTTDAFISWAKGS